MSSDFQNEVERCWTYSFWVCYCLKVCSCKGATFSCWSDFLIKEKVLCPVELETVKRSMVKGLATLQEAPPPPKKKKMEEILASRRAVANMNMGVVD